LTPLHFKHNAENIRIALATIQHFYTIDVTQYQEGTQSLLRDFRNDSISIDAETSINFFDNVLSDVFSSF